MIAISATSWYFTEKPNTHINQPRITKKYQDTGVQYNHLQTIKQSAVFLSLFVLLCFLWFCSSIQQFTFSLPRQHFWHMCVQTHRSLAVCKYLMLALGLLRGKDLLFKITCGLFYSFACLFFATEGLKIQANLQNASYPWDQSYMLSVCKASFLSISNPALFTSTLIITAFVGHLTISKKLWSNCQKAALRHPGVRVCTWNTKQTFLYSTTNGQKLHKIPVSMYCINKYSQ